MADRLVARSARSRSVQPFLAATWWANRPGASDTPVRKYRVNPEGALHRSVAELLDWCLIPPALYSTFPSGWGQLNKATAGTLKACGLKAGWPDIMVFSPRRCVGI